MSSLSLLVLAAGMGSRYGGLKQIDPMGPSGETLLDYSVYDALQSGFDRIVFLIRPDIEDAFRQMVGSRYRGSIQIDYAFQQLHSVPGKIAIPSERTKPWGTAHAVWCARAELSGPFVAINADDFYGGKSYAKLAEFFAGKPPGGTQFAMAGYRLSNTLSDHGSVARGVCGVDDSHHLTSIVECPTIEHQGERIFQKEPDGTERSFTGDEAVSMNFWGLTPAVFPLLESKLFGFLQKSSLDLKAEFYLPTAIGDMIRQGEASVEVLPTDAPWFGVTYRDDKPLVTSALAELHRSGAYPTPLWK